MRYFVGSNHGQVLLFTVAMPTYLMLLAAMKSDGLDAGDVGFSAAMVAFVAITFLADQQQWSERSAPMVGVLEALM